MMSEGTVSGPEKLPSIRIINKKERHIFYQFHLSGDVNVNLAFIEFILTVLIIS